MKWNYATRPNGEREPYGLVSSCERFRIAKAIVGSLTFYSLFDGNTLVFRYASPNQAKARAEEILREKNPG